MPTSLTPQQQLMRQRAICVVIPTYNNGATVARVAAEARQQCADIIVIDDGSTDATLAQLQQVEGITIVHYDRNRGKGHALKVGFRKALAMGFAYAITLDADGQHYAHDIATFVEENQAHPGALLMGSRRMTGIDRSRGSSFANRFSNFWFWVQTGRRLDDTQTGYRLYPLRKLHGLALLTSRYEAELALIVLASWHGVELRSVAIDVYYPPRNERVSHFRPTADFLRITALNCVLCLLALVYGLPLRLWRALMTVVRTVYALLFFLFFMFVVMTPAAWLYIKLGRMTERKRMNLHRLIQEAARTVVLRHGIPGVRFTYNVSPDVSWAEPHVVICNHQSHLDLICQLILTPRIVFLTNNWVWHNPSYGFLIRHAEYLQASDGIEALLPQLRSLVARGYSIAVFPEGTRSADCRIGRFHQGAFWMAGQLGVSVVPMCLYGPGKILPKKTYHLRRGQIHLEVGSPIPLAELAAMGDCRQQARTLRHRYQQWYADLANRLEQDA